MRVFFICLLGLLMSPFVTKAAPIHIQLQLKWKHQFQFAGYYMALEKGYYRDVGLNVEILEGEPSEHATKFLKQGRHRYAVGEISDMLAYVKGEKIRVLMALYQHSPKVVIVREDSGIRHFSELAGHRLMLSEGLKYGEIRAALEASGVHADDVTVEQNDAYVIESLQRGTVDGMSAYLSNEPYTLDQMGVPYRILHPRDIGIDFYDDFLLTSEDEVMRYPQEVRAFVKATKQGWRDALLQPEEAIALIQKKYNTQHLSHDKLLYEANTLMPLLAWDRVDVGYISEHRLSLMVKTFVRLGWLDKPFDASGFLYDVDHLSDEEVWLESHAWQLLGSILFFLLVLAILSLGYARKVLRHKTADLVASEAMWRHFVDIADIGIFIHSQGKILFANTYMLERMGMTAEGVIGVKIAKHIHPDDLLLVAQRVQDIMEHDAVIRGESVRYISSSGEMFDVEISSLRILFNGELSVLGVARDITAKKCAEAALKASETQYRQLVERSPDAVLVHQDGVWCFANSIGLELMGAETAKDLLGRSVLRSVHPDDRDIVTERMKNRVSKEEALPLIEERLLRLDGSEFWAEVTGIPVEHEGRSASLVIARDVTQRKNSEMALRQEKRNMQTILKHAPIGIWMSDLNGSIQLINKAFTDAVGISAETFVAADAYVDLLPKDMAVSCRASDQACIQTKQKVMAQEYIPCVDGKLRIFDVIKAPVLDDEGRMLGVVGLSIDASERMEAEAEKERMQHQVEHTQRLESLGVLAGGVAHDFNNILATILGNASLIQCKLPTDTDVSLHLQRIVMASEKASLLCSQMLAYAGQGQIAVRSLNMTDLSRSIASLLEVSIGVGVELSYDLDANLPMIDADEAQIQQLVMNLVINASEAMDGMNGGHIALKISMKKILPEDLQAAVGEPDVRLADDYVCLQVLDDGWMSVCWSVCLNPFLRRNLRVEAWA